MAIEILTAEDLDNVRNNLSGEYIQMADIDLSGYANWVPIDSFDGQYDGNKFIIDNLSQNETSFLGLFGSVSNATIKNVRLTNVSITGTNAIGALCAQVSGSSSEIINCKALSGQITGTNTLGGLIGQVFGNPTIDKCSSGININGIADIYSGNYVGGLIGQVLSGINATECYAYGNVQVMYGNAGGLIGDIDFGYLLDCFARGSVVSVTTNEFTTCNFGGLIGYYGASASGEFSAINCYSIGLISQGITVYGSMGGLIGVIESYEWSSTEYQITNSYYDSETSGQSDIDKGIPKTTIEMKAQATFLSWDFAEKWKIDEGNTYPAFYLDTPTTTPSGETFSGSVTVTIGNVDTDCVAYYTTDGTTPTTDSTAYIIPFTLSVSASMKVAAYNLITGLWSDVVSAKFIKNAEPDPGGDNPNVPALITKELKTLTFKRASHTDTKQAADATNDNFRQVSSYTGAVTKTMKQYNQNFAAITQYQTDMNAYIANLETLLIAAGIMPAPE